LLNDTQTHQFMNEGYVAAPGFFDATEVHLLQKEVARLRQLGLLRNVRVATAGDGASPPQNLQLCPAHPHSRVVRALPFSVKVRAAVTALLGDPTLYHLDQIFYKPARAGGGTKWHTDNAYFQYADVMRGMGMWIAIHDATVETGTMHVVPRSHLQTFAHQRDAQSDHHIFCDVNTSEAVAVELPAGGALFFNYGVAHCTTDNRSERDRAGLALHFQHHPGPPVGQDDRAPSTIFADALITGPAATFGQSELGESMEGVWESLVKMFSREVV